MSYKSDKLALISLGLGCQATGQMYHITDLYFKVGFNLTYYSSFFNWMICEAKSVADTIINYQDREIPQDDFILQGNYFKLKDYNIWFYHDIFTQPKEDRFIRHHRNMLYNKYNYLLKKFYSFKEVPNRLFIMTNAQNNFRDETYCRLNHDYRITKDNQLEIIEVINKVFKEGKNKIRFVGYDDCELEETEHSVFVEVDDTEWRGEPKEWLKIWEKDIQERNG